MSRHIRMVQSTDKFGDDCVDVVTSGDVVLARISVRSNGQDWSCIRVYNIDSNTDVSIFSEIGVRAGLTDGAKCAPSIDIDFSYSPS